MKWWPHSRPAAPKLFSSRNHDEPQIRGGTALGAADEQRDSRSGRAGSGAGLLGFDQSVPVSSFLPILMFAILFGLSMDYEVFLLSRIREDWLETGDARGSVVRGLAGTGRVISTAAAVMVAVFLGFATESDLVVQQLGVGMAVAIMLDATIVRMVLVPATMTMLGHRNWWLPRWLDRLLPSVEAETNGRPWDQVAAGVPDAPRDEPRVITRS